ncbi:MAG: hypothetical protein K0S51_1445 [Bacillales bacterium]|jgi:uncharacterized integral membrane protein (TIGR02327 family)|nr:hypothetical protein [Bacillales bacterium]
MESVIAGNAILGICVNLIFIAITWWSLQSLQIDKLFKKGKTMQIQVFYILLTISIAQLASDFVMSYFQYTQGLQYLFQ